MPIKSQEAASLHGDQPGIDHNSNGATKGGWKDRNQNCVTIESKNCLIRFSPTWRPFTKSSTCGRNGRIREINLWNQTAMEYAQGNSCVP